jgi:hypothetical protein
VDVDNDDDGLDDYYIVLQAVYDGSIVGIADEDDSSYSGAVQYRISNYTGSKHGISEGIKLDIDTSEEIDVIIWAGVYAITPNVTTSDTITIKDYSIEETAPATVEDKENFTLEARVLDAALNTSDLNGETMRVFAYIGDTAVNIKKAADGSYSSYIEFTISNYEGSKYGISESISLELLGQTHGATVTIYVATTDPWVTTSDTSTYAAPKLVFTSEPTIMDRDEEVTLALKVTNAAGTTKTALAPGVALALAGADASDVMSDGNIGTGDWTNGTVSIADFQITGGTGDETGVTITASADGYQSVTTSSFSIYEYSFEFTTEPSSVTRGTNFTLAIKIVNAAGETLTTKAPTAALVLAGADGSDVLSDTDIASGEWSNGTWTSSTLQITGGTGAESGVTITCSASNYDSGVTGEFTTSPPAPEEVSAASGAIYYGADADQATGDPDGESSDSSRWAAVQSNAKTNFDSDSSMGAGYTTHYSIKDIYSYISMGCSINGGYSKFTLSEDQKTNGSNLTLKPDCWWANYNHNYDFNPSAWGDVDDIDNIQLDIYLSESAATFATGLALGNMTPHVTFSGSTLKAAMIAADDDYPGVSTNKLDCVISLDLNAGSFLSGMSGNDVYVWGSVRDTSNVPWVLENHGFVFHADFANIEVVYA